MLIGSKAAYNLLAINHELSKRKQPSQTYFATLDDQVPADNAVRLIDTFVDMCALFEHNCAT